MRAHLIEVLAPGFDDDLGLGAREKPFGAQALVAELAVEAFRDATLLASINGSPTLPERSSRSPPAKNAPSAF